MVNVSMNKSRSIYFLHPKLAKRIKIREVALQAWSDGGHRKTGCSACAAVVKAWHKKWPRPMVLVAAAKSMPGDNCDSVTAETCGLELASLLVQTIIKKGCLSQDD
eukprot:1921682-Karenia_brevis.AAC.1